MIGIKVVEDTVEVAQEISESIKVPRSSGMTINQAEDTETEMISDGEFEEEDRLDYNKIASIMDAKKDNLEVYYEDSPEAAKFIKAMDKIRKADKKATKHKIGTNTVYKFVVDGKVAVIDPESNIVIIDNDVTDISESSAVASSDKVAVIDPESNIMIIDNDITESVEMNESSGTSEVHFVPTKANKGFEKLVDELDEIDADLWILENSEDITIPWDYDFTVEGKNVVLTGHAGPHGLGEAVVTVPIASATKAFSFSVVGPKSAESEVVKILKVLDCEIK